MVDGDLIMPTGQDWNFVLRRLVAGGRFFGAGFAARAGLAVDRVGAEGGERGGGAVGVEAPKRLACLVESEDIASSPDRRRGWRCPVRRSAVRLSRRLPGTGARGRRSRLGRRRVRAGRRERPPAGSGQGPWPGAGRIPRSKPSRANSRSSSPCPSSPSAGRFPLRPPVGSDFPVAASLPVPEASVTAELQRTWISRESRQGWSARQEKGCVSKMVRGPCTRPGTALQRPEPWVLRRYADGRTAFAGPCKTAAMDRSQRALAGSSGLAVLPPRTRPYARWWLLALPPRRLPRQRPHGPQPRADRRPRPEPRPPLDPLGPPPAPAAGDALGLARDAAMRRPRGLAGATPPAAPRWRCRRGRGRRRRSSACGSSAGRAVLRAAPRPDRCRQRGRRSARRRRAPRHR